MDHINFSLASVPLTHEINFVSNTKPFIPKARTSSYHLLRYLTEGNMELVIENESFSMVSNSLILIPAGTEYSGSEWTSDETSWYDILFFLPPTTDPVIELDKLITISASSSVSPIDYHYSVRLPKFVQLSKENVIETRIQLLLKHFESASPLKFGYQGAILSAIFMDMINAKSQIESTNPEASKINILIKYLNEHSHDPFRSEVIATETNLNYKYLCEVFKKKTGNTIQQYHTMLKMKEAERLLRTTELSIREISESLGYQDSLYFSNVFKKNHHMSPKKYRNSFYEIEFSGAIIPSE